MEPEMAQQIKALAARHDNLNMILKTLTVEGEK